MASSLVNNKYRITKRIGGGSFGEIYMGVGPNNERVAVKFERHGTRCPQLRHEYKVYRELANCHGFCQVYHFGTQDNYNVMVMDLLGPSLEDLFNKCNRRFSLKTVLQIADQMLERVDTLHSRHLIHRDIKPANFVIGLGETAANIYCVDFGLSKRYRHPKNLQHIPHRDGRSLTGTPRYASINNHLGIEQSRRDDLESVGYVLIYFLKGSLPWQGLKAKNAQKKYRLILEKKQQVSIAQLCQGCPSQFAEFLAYTRSLKFDAKPDIPYLRKLFRDLYHAQNCGAIPKLWDWDGMDLEHTSTTGSQPGGVPAPQILGAVGGGAPQMSSGLGLRPTTAAAVATGNVMDRDDMLLGGGGMGVGDDLDDDFGADPRAHQMDRPNTAGAMLGRSSAQQPGNSAAAWGYPRQDNGAPKPGAGGIAEYGADQQRRPHTAHGARGPVAGGGMNYPGAGMGGQDKMLYSEQDMGEDGNHVVAGAREMMRYRRNRMEQGGQGQPVAGMGNPGMMGVPPSAGQYKPSSAGGWNGDPASNPGGQVPAPWAIYQQNAAAGKPQPGGMPVGMTPQQQAQAAAARKTTVGGQPAPATATSSGWSPFTSDRPKSAVAAPSANPGGMMQSSGGGGLVSALTGGRPATSSQQPQQMAAGGQWNQTAGNNPAAMANNANTLSYGSLKNRFLSGGATKTTPTPTTSAGGAPVASSAQNAAANQANAGMAKSKLFSLAR